jgi:hypothetical protein
MLSKGITLKEDITMKIYPARAISDVHYKVHSLTVGGMAL